jgi:hypothetical protein
MGEHVLLMAIIYQAVQDARYGNQRQRQSARDFLQNASGLFERYADELDLDEPVRERLADLAR